MDNQKITSDADFKAICSMIHREFERVANYIQEQIYFPEIVSPQTTAGKREHLVHKNSNLAELVSLINNAVNETAPNIVI